MPRGLPRLTRSVIDPDEVLASIDDAEAGGVALFLGTVRNHSEAGKVDRIEYEAYEPMAEKGLLQAEEEIRKRWPATKKIRIVHRLGKLSIGDVSVAVAVSSPHRAEAFEACRFGIEMIKHEVPIWKRERLADGREVWVEGVALSLPRRSPPGVTDRRKSPRRR